MGSCRDFVRVLGDYLDGALLDRVREECDAHLLECGRCRLLLETTRKTVHLFKEAWIPAIPPEVEERLMRNTEEIWRLVDAHQDDFIALSDRVWEMPELCYTEFRSCAEHTAMLEAKGFRVTRDVAGIPTAVMGEAGEEVFAGGGWLPYLENVYQRQ